MIFNIFTRMIAAFLAFGIFLFIEFIFEIPSDNKDFLKTDAIVVFTGGKKRVISAAALFKQDLAPYFYISGVDKNTTKKQMLAFMKIEDHSKVFSGNAQNTKENAKETIEWASTHNIKSIRLVTTSYHMPRSLWELKRQGAEFEITPHALPVYDASLQKTLYDFISEFVKLQLLRLGFSYPNSF